MKVYLLQSAGEWDDWPTPRGVYATLEEAEAHIPDDPRSDLEIVAFDVGAAPTLDVEYDVTGLASWSEQMSAGELVRESNANRTKAAREAAREAELTRLHELGLLPTPAPFMGSIAAVSMASMLGPKVDRL